MNATTCVLSWCRGAALILFVCLLGGCGSHTKAAWTAPPDWKSFREPSLGVEVSFPPDMFVRNWFPDSEQTASIQKLGWHHVVDLDNDASAPPSPVNAPIKAGCLRVIIWRRELEPANSRQSMDLAGEWPTALGGGGEARPLKVHGVDCAELTREAGVSFMQPAERVVFRVSNGIAYALLIQAFQGADERQKDLLTTRIGDDILASVHE